MQYKPEKAKSSFQRHLRRVVLELNKMTYSQGIEAMLSFYRDERTEGCCSFDKHADALLFQWGTYDWGYGNFFDFSISRQLIFGGSEDQKIWQLSLIFRFTPCDAHRKLSAGNKWCSTLADIAQYKKFIHDSKAFQLVVDKIPGKVKLEFECAS